MFDETYSDEAVDIGAVIDRSGLPASTLHLWERRGLISSVGRVGLRRQYPVDVFERLAFVVVCQRARFTLDVIGELIDDLGDGRKERLQEQLQDLLHQRVELDQAIDGLQHAIDCPEPEPFRCDAFRRKLADALPRVVG